MHGRDLARPIGADETLDPDVVAALWAFAEPLSGMLSSTGYFTCPSGDVPDTAPLQTRLLDLLGRRPYGESASQPAQPLMRQLNAHISGQSGNLAGTESPNEHANQIRQALRATGGIKEHGGEPFARVPHERCNQRDGWARQLPSVTVRLQQSAARRATHANDHQGGLPIHRPGTLPSDPQIVQSVTPSVA